MGAPSKWKRGGGVNGSLGSDTAGGTGGGGVPARFTIRVGRLNALWNQPNSVQACSYDSFAGTVAEPGVIGVLTVGVVMVDSLGLIFDTVFPEQPPESEAPESLGLRFLFRQDETTVDSLRVTTQELRVT